MGSRLMLRETRSRTREQRLERRRSARVGLLDRFPSSQYYIHLYKDIITIYVFSCVSMAKTQRPQSAGHQMAFQRRRISLNTTEFKILCGDMNTFK